MKQGGLFSQHIFNLAILKGNIFKEGFDEKD